MDVRSCLFGIHNTMMLFLVLSIILQICILLRDSQFVADNVTDSQVSEGVILV